MNRIHIFFSCVRTKIKGYENSFSVFLIMFTHNNKILRFITGPSRLILLYYITQFIQNLQETVTLKALLFFIRNSLHISFYGSAVNERIIKQNIIYADAR